MADITDGLKELRLHSMAGDWMQRASYQKSHLIQKDMLS